jgi:hypothetical protein
VPAPARSDGWALALGIAGTILGLAGLVLGGLAFGRARRAAVPAGQRPAPEPAPTP